MAATKRAQAKSSTHAKAQAKKPARPAKPAPKKPAAKAVPKKAVAAKKPAPKPASRTAKPAPKASKPAKVAPKAEPKKVEAPKPDPKKAKLEAPKVVKPEPKPAKVDPKAAKVAAADPRAAKVVPAEAAKAAKADAKPTKAEKAAEAKAAKLEAVAAAQAAREARARLAAKRLEQRRAERRAAREARPKPPPLPLRQYKLIGVPALKPLGQRVEAPPPPPPPPPEPKPATIEERVARIHERLAKLGDEFQTRYQDALDMSWIYHDSALEGVVYSYQELKTALDPSATIVQESSLQPVVEEIRRHKAAIEFVRDHAKKKLPVTLDVVKKIYLILHPEEGDLKTLKYRKDIPQHRLYFHDYAPPDKIAYKARQVIDWVNDPETKKGRNAIRIAARAHFDFLRVYPFTHDSGKVSRLLMNLLLMRAGYEPAIIHSTERQRYYEALKGAAAVILHMAQEAVENGLASIEKLLDDEAAKARPAPAPAAPTQQIAN